MFVLQARDPVLQHGAAPVRQELRVAGHGATQHDPQPRVAPSPGQPQHPQRDHHQRPATAPDLATPGAWGGVRPLTRGQTPGQHRDLERDSDRAIQRDRGRRDQALGHHRAQGKLRRGKVQEGGNGRLNTYETHTQAALGDCLLQRPEAASRGQGGDWGDESGPLGQRRHCQLHQVIKPNDRDNAAQFKHLENR